MFCFLDLVCSFVALLMCLSEERYQCWRSVGCCIYFTSSLGLWGTYAERVLQTVWENKEA